MLAMIKPPTSQSQMDTLTDGQLRTLLGVAFCTRSLAELEDTGAHWESVVAANSVTGSSRELLQKATSALCTVEELRSTKDIAKRMLSRATSADQKDTAALMYSVAVAAAHAHHRTNISSRPLQEQLEVFRRLARIFEDQALGPLFSGAASSLSR